MDECYQLVKGRNDFGKETIETIMSVMDGEANVGTSSRSSIILAGYEDGVKQVVQRKETHSSRQDSQHRQTPTTRHSQQNKTEKPDQQKHASTPKHT